MARKLTLIIGTLISLGAAYIILRGDLNTIQDEISGGRYEYMIPTTFFFALALVTRGFRWQSLLGHKTSAWHAFHIMNVGYLLNSLPLRIGELARAWLTTRLTPPIKFLTALSSIAVERVLDLIAVMTLLGIALLTLDVPAEVQATGAVVGSVTLIAAVLMVYFAHQRAFPHRVLALANRMIPPLQRLNLTEWLDHFLDGLEPLTSARIRVEAVFWTVISWGLSVIVGYLMMLVFFDEANLPGVMLTIVLLSLAVAIPSVPGNLGTFEAAGVAGMYAAGIISAVEAPENAPAVAFSLLLHALTLVGYILFGIVGLWAEQTSLGQVRSGMQQVQQTQEG